MVCVGTATDALHIILSCTLNFQRFIIDTSFYQLVRKRANTRVPLSVVTKWLKKSSVSVTVWTILSSVTANISEMGVFQAPWRGLAKSLPFWGNEALSTNTLPYLEKAFHGLLRKVCRLDDPRKITTTGARSSASASNKVIMDHKGPEMTLTRYNTVVQRFWQNWGVPFPL